MLEIKTFGGFSLYKNGQAVKDLGSHKAEAILVYLATENGPHNRNALATLLWPESAPDHALTSLRVVLSILHKNLGDYLEISRDTVCIKPDAPVTLDLSVLSEKLANGQVSEALEIYQGDFLQGFSLRDSLEFEDWRRLQQERAHRLITSALHTAISSVIASEDYKEGLSLVHRLLELDPPDELAHRKCMLLLALDGQRIPALAQYEKCQAILQAELGVAASPETQELHNQIDLGLRPSLRLAGATTLIPPHNLPSPQTSFIGREPELAQITALIRDPACRLLTLVGPGGMGKTRLALRAAARCLPYFTDGAWFVPLESLSSPHYLASSISGAVHFKIDIIASDLDPRQQLLDYLRNRSILLVLDGFEKLVAGAELLADLISRASRLKLLVTSRQKLDLMGEWTFPVSGLPVPQTSTAASPDDPSAVKLFCERSRQAKTDFQLSTADREEAIHICSLVEGMPLGIELAAAWTPVLSLPEITAEIQKNLDFLSTSRRDGSEKHRSLRAAFDSSWLLLDEEQRNTFCQLSAFHGSFDRHAALSIAGASLDQLSTLVDKSMLNAHGAGRFSMHGLLRQYASEKLDPSSPDWEVVRHRHCLYYTGFLSQRETDLLNHQMYTAWDEVRQEMDNVRSALHWAVIHWEAEPIRKLFVPLLAYFIIQGWHEGKDFFNDLAQVRREALLARNVTNASQDPVYLSARIHQAFLLSNLSLNAESEAISQECLQPLSEQNLIGELSECLQNLGLNASYRGEYDLSRQRLEQAVLIGKDSGIFIWPTYLLWLGHTYFLLGEYEHGMESFQKCRELFDRQGNIWGLGFTLSKMGLAYDGLGEFTKAMQVHRQALAIFEKTGNRAGKAYVLSRMSMAACFLEEYPQAVQLGQEGYQIFQLLGHRWGITTSLCRLGFAYLGLGDMVKAKSCFAEALQQSRQNQMTPLSLYALAGLAAVLSQEKDDQTSLELFRYVQQHPQAPALYPKQASRWIVQLDQAAPIHGYAASYKGAENESIDDIVDRFMKNGKLSLP